MESLKNLREPIAVTAIIVLMARVLIGVGTAAAYASREGFGGLSNVAVLGGYRGGDPALVVVLTLAIAACVLTDRTRHARVLTVLAVVAVGVSVLVAAVFAVIALAAPDGIFVLDTLDVLANLAVPVLGLVTLVKLLALLPAGNPVAQPYAQSYGQPSTPSYPLPPGQQAGTGQPAIDQVPPPQYQPTWQPDVAAGAAWHTAGDAAAGAPASGWGTPGQQGGWHYPPPGPQQPTQQAPAPQQQAQQPPASPPPAQQAPGGYEQPPNWLGGGQS
jgi:hypothetical protein